MSDHFYIRQKVENLFLGNGICPHIFYEDINLANVLQNLRQDDGISFISRSLFARVMQQQELDKLLSGMKLLPLKNRDACWTIGYKISASGTNSADIMAFMRFVEQVYEDQAASIELFLKDFL